MLYIARGLSIALGLSAAAALAGEPPLTVSLRNEARSPVYLTAGKQGIVAHSVLGRFRRTLVSGPVSQATYDASAQVVFYPCNDMLVALDLRKSQPRPVRVVELREDFVNGGHEDYAIRTLDDRGSDTNSQAISWVLHWKTGAIRSTNPRRPPIIFGTWLRDNAARPLRPRPVVPVKAHRPFGKTNVEMLYEAHLGERTQCLLRDRAERLYSPESPNKLLDDESTPKSTTTFFEFDETETAWLLEKWQICSTSQGCMNPDGGRLLGWLHPGPIYNCPPDDAR